MKVLPLVLFIVLSGISLEGRGQRFTVGAAQRTINPDQDSLYLAGGKPNRPFIDVHDDLYVKAVYIGHAQTQITLLTFDCIGLMYPELLQIRQEVARVLPAVDAAHIVMSSTHTHAGPDVVGIWGKDYAHSGVNQAHMRKIITMAVAAIREAYQQRSPCTMEYAMGSFGEDWVKNISEPSSLDRQVSVLRFLDKRRKAVATLTNFACHPTILDDATTAASADYLWGYYHFLDSAQGGVNLFLQGAIGGWVQPEDVPSSFGHAFYYGSKLGKYSYEILQKAIPAQSHNISFKGATVRFPMKNPTFTYLSKAGVILRAFSDTVESEIACFSIGEAVFATHPGETVPALSIATKALMGGSGPKFVMGLAQDALGYILKPEFFQKGHPIPHSEYLTSMSIGPDTQDIILNVLKTLLKP